MFSQLAGDGGLMQEFRRVVSLPEDVEDPDRIQARYQDGVLHVTAQRLEAAKPRKIVIN